MANHVSMLTATDARSHVHLIIGSNPLAAARCTQSLGAGASPVLLAPAMAELHYALQKRVDDGEVKRVEKTFEDRDLFTLGRPDVGHVVDAVFVTSAPRDPLGMFAPFMGPSITGPWVLLHGRFTTDITRDLASHISALCKRNRIPVNVVDAPHLCTFTLLSTHTDGPLQIGVTTNGRGCKLASRIRRDIAASLPPNLGAACARLGDMRRRIHEEDHLVHDGNSATAAADGGGDLDDSVDQSASFNKLVTDADRDAAKNRRARWLSQVCEYWPLKRLAAITDEDVDAILNSYSAQHQGRSESIGRPGPNGASGGGARGRIILAGSGPGHPDLLTRATLKAIEAADLVLADKLVPSGVLDLIPRRTPVKIARKFPGNADAAQEELHELAVAAAREGRTVLRLKQGDPYIYGRGGEEVEHFRRQGLGDRVFVLPGVTSALSAPLFAGVPPTQRDVADQVLVCTGTGKKGKPPAPPSYVASRTVVFLMALHRIGALVEELTTYNAAAAANGGTTAAKDPGVAAPTILPTTSCNGTEQQSPNPETQNRQTQTPTLQEQQTRTLWPRTTPCAVLERASCPDQRVIRTTLDRVAEAVEHEGSRPPGLLVVGRACDFLHPARREPEAPAWSVEEGFRGLDFAEDVAAVAGLADLGGVAA